MAKQLKVSEALELIKPRLTEYMELIGIRVSPSGSFKCPNSFAHKHGDANPSGWINSSGSVPRWKCYTCDSGGDITDLAAFVYGYPLEGKGFRLVTLPAILSTLGEDIEVVPDEPETESSEEITTHRIISKLLEECPVKPEHLSDFRPYPISEELAKLIATNCKIAYTDNYEKLPKDYLQSALSPFKPSDLPTCPALIIPITYDGIYVGTVTRLPNEAIELGARKYYHSRKLVAYPSVLGIDSGISVAKRRGHLFIVEGVFNYLSLYAYGIRNIVGVLGVSSLSDSLSRTIIEAASIKEVTIIPDKDKTGREAAFKFARSLLDLGIYVSFFIPAEDSPADHDEEVSAKGTEYVSQILEVRNHYGILEYSCKYKLDYLSDESGLSIPSKFQAYLHEVSKYGNPTSAKTYASFFAEYVIQDKDAETDLLPHIRQVLMDPKSSLHARLDNLVSSHLGKLSEAKSLDDKVSVIYSLYNSVKNNVKNVSLGIRGTAIRRLDELLRWYDGSGAHRFDTGFPNLDRGPRRIDLHHGLLVGLIGKPSHAKSVFVRSFALHQALTYPDNVLVIYVSTDDTIHTTLSWILAHLSNVPYQTVIRAPSERTEQENSSIKKAEQLLRSVYGKSLLIFDKSTVRSIESIVRLVDDLAVEYPQDRHRILITDNMYNLDNISSAKSETGKRAAVDMVIETYKQLASEKVSLVFNTLESRKTNGRVREHDIKESGSVDYRNDVTLSIFNSYREYRERSLMVERVGDTIVPIIELTILKRKYGESGITNYFLLNGAVSRLTPIVNQSRISELDVLRLEDNGSLKNTNAIANEEPVVYEDEDIDVW